MRKPGDYRRCELPSVAWRGLGRARVDIRVSGAVILESMVTRGGVPFLTLFGSFLFCLSGCRVSRLALCSPGFAAVFLRHGHKFTPG